MHNPGTGWRRKKGQTEKHGRRLNVVDVMMEHTGEEETDEHEDSRTHCAEREIT
jgi:hypothetical protein